MSIDIPDCLECGETFYVLPGARFVCSNEDCDKCDEPITLDAYENELQNIAERAQERRNAAYHDGGSTGFKDAEEVRQQWIQDHLKR